MNGELLKEIEEKLEILERNYDIYAENIKYLRNKTSCSEEETQLLYQYNQKLSDTENAIKDLKKYYSLLEAQDELDVLYRSIDDKISSNKIDFLTVFYTKTYDYLDVEEIKHDLCIIGSNSTKKDETYNSYNDLLKTSIEDIIKDDKKYNESLLEEPTRLKGFTLNKNAGIVVGGIAGLVILVALLKSCGNNSRDIIPTDDTTDNKYTTESPFETTTAYTPNETTTANATEEQTTTTPETSLSENDILVNALVKNGYSKDLAEAIVNKYNGYVIAELLAKKFVNGINVDYIMEYIDVKERYNISLNEAVDYVNRAMEIGKLNYFYDATLYDVINVLIAINNKDIIKGENNDLEQAIFNPLNDMAEKYYFYENTPDDIVRLEALKYFAKDNTDLDEFLEIYSEYLQKLIKDPYDKKSRDELMHGFAIYASSLNHFDNAECALSDDKEFNEAFQVRDPFDYAIAYKTIITPTNPFYIYPEIYNIDGEHFEYFATLENEEYRNAEIDRFGYSEYKDIINKLIEFRGLNKLVDTAIGENEELNCGKSRSLGGE